MRIFGVVGQIWNFCRRIIRGKQDVDSPSCGVRGVFEFVGVAGHVSRRLFWAIKSVSTTQGCRGKCLWRSAASGPNEVRSDRSNQVTFGPLLNHSSPTSFTRRKQLQRASSAISSLNSTPQFRSASSLVELLDFPK